MVFKAAQFKSLMRFQTKMLFSCFNKIMNHRLEVLKPAVMKQEEFASVVIKPSYTDIFVPEFIQQLLETQKVNYYFITLLYLIHCIMNILFRY